MPDEADLAQTFKSDGEDEPENVSQSGSGDKPPNVRAFLKFTRPLMRLSPLLSIVLLLLVTLFGVRSFKGWLRWWGIPFLVVGILLGVGVLAATAVTRSEGETLFAQSSAREPSSSSGTEVSGTEVVTKTVERKGQPVRVVRRLETTVQDLTTLPGRTVRETQAITIRETHTATVREVATVTAIQPVTVTVFETVTCKPKDC